MGLKWSKGSWALYGLATAVLGVAGMVVAGAPEGAAAEPVKVGVMVPLSPPGAVERGRLIREGFELARDLLNAQGGVKGRPLELLFEDSQGLPERGRAAAEKLITLDRVVALTGEHHSNVALAEIEVAHRYGVPFVGTNTWADAIREKGYDEVFMPNMYSSRATMAAAQVIQGLGARRVLMLQENTEFGTGQASSLRRFLQEMAPQIQYSVQVLDREARDFTPTVLALRANPPDVIVLAINPPALYVLTNQLYELGVAPSRRTWVLDSAGFADNPDFWRNVGEGAVTQLGVLPFHPRMALTPLGQRVAEAYRSRTGRNAHYYIFQAFDSLLVIQDAANRSASLEPANLVRALKATRVEGTRAVITFEQTPGYLWQQWKDIPVVVFQITERNQPYSETRVVMGPGVPFDPANLVRPR